MNTTVATSIEAQLAELSRVTDAPSGALDFGRDLSCVTDITEDCIEVDGSSALIVAQAVTRRFLTPRGALLDDPNYGCDVTGLLNKGVTVQELRAFNARLEAEAMKDERVASAAVLVTFSYAAQSLSIAVTITPKDPRASNFSFVLSVTTGQVLIDLQDK